MLGNWQAMPCAMPGATLGTCASAWNQPWRSLCGMSHSTSRLLRAGVSLVPPKAYNHVSCHTSTEILDASLADVGTETNESDAFTQHCKYLCCWLYGA